MSVQLLVSCTAEACCSARTALVAAETFSFRRLPMELMNDAALPNAMAAPYTTMASTVATTPSTRFRRRLRVEATWV